VHASRLLGDTSTRLSVAPACAEGEWPHEQWPPPDDPHVGRALRVLPPYGELREKGLADAVVLRCDQPSTEFRVLLRAMGAVRVPVIVVGPLRDAETVVEVCRGGAGYLVEGDYCTCMLSLAVGAVTVGHSYLSPAACAAARDVIRQMPGEKRQARERLRPLLSPRERQIMELLCTGLGAQEIGLRLRLSERRPSATTSATSTPSSTRGGARRPSRNGSARRRLVRA